MAKEIAHEGVLNEVFKATDSEMHENGILFPYKGDELVGITILEASKRRK